MTFNSKLAVFNLVLLQLYFAQAQTRDYRTLGLLDHNSYRAKHDSPRMKLDSNLNEKAEKCAEYYARARKIDHSCSEPPNTGENLYMMTGAVRNHGEDVKEAIQLWYDEIVDYNFERPEKKPRGKMIGHFTQLVWKASIKLGIGVKTVGDCTVVVAKYSPQGNVIYNGGYSWYLQNVQRPGTGEFSKSFDYQILGLEDHNSYRENHDSPPMKMDYKLNQKAEYCADYYARARKIDHSCKEPPNTGENLYMLTGVVRNPNKSVEKAIKLWYDEIEDYNFEHPGRVPSNRTVGHFTQLVWKNSTRLGIGVKTVGNCTVVVAKYSAHGNVISHGNYSWYKQNVQRPKTGVFSKASSTKLRSASNSLFLAFCFVCLCFFQAFCSADV